MKKLIVLLTLALAIGCTKKEEPAPGVTAEAPKAAAPATENNVTISSVGETMAYDKPELTVKSGDEVTLTFKNNSTTLEHNWVLTKPGKDNDVGVAGIQAGRDKQFIPDTQDVIAHTKLVAPKGQKDATGQVSTGEDTIKFKAPAPGDYPYICTNAGHHTVMKGVLHSK